MKLHFQQLNIKKKLKDRKAKKMAELLEKTDSSYFPAFKDLFSDTVNALEEAQDIDIHLKPLIGHFEAIESTEFDELIPCFGPMFHNICLVWSNSKFYCRPARIIVLLQEINNSIMKRASSFLEPIDLFKGEIEESSEKVRQVYDILQAYKSTYEKYRAKVKTYFKEGDSAKEWEYSPKLVFARWDSFMDRMNMIKVSRNKLNFSQKKRI
jgi:dynein heavy chain